MAVITDCLCALIAVRRPSRLLKPFRIGTPSLGSQRRGTYGSFVRAHSHRLWRRLSWLGLADAERSSASEAAHETWPLSFSSVRSRSVAIACRWLGRRFSIINLCLEDAGKPAFTRSRMRFLSAVGPLFDRMCMKIWSKESSRSSLPSAGCLILALA